MTWLNPFSREDIQFAPPKYKLAYMGTFLVLFIATTWTLFGLENIGIIQAFIIGLITATLTNLIWLRVKIPKIQTKN